MSRAPGAKLIAQVSRAPSSEPFQQL